MSEGRPTAVELRRKEIARQLDRLRRQLSAKSSKDYQSESRYKYWRARRQALINELEEELSILDEPGEYAELPRAVVADELGISLAQVKALIDSGELEACGRSPHYRVSRREIERASVIGGAALLKRAGQDLLSIFNDAVGCIQSGDLESAEVCYKRIEARDPYPGLFEIPLRIALDLANGEYDKVLSDVEYLKDQNHLEREMTVANLALVLSRVQFKEDKAKRIAEHLLAEGGATHWHRTELGYEKEHEIQNLTAYLTTVVDEMTRKFCRTNLSDRERNKLMTLVRDAIYTGLHASESYEVSVTSRLFVDKIQRSTSGRAKHPKLKLDIGSGMKKVD